SSKDINNSKPPNHYYRCRFCLRPDSRTTLGTRAFIEPFKRAIRPACLGRGVFLRGKGALVTVLAVLALATATVASDLHEGLPAFLLAAQEPAQSQTPGPAPEGPPKPALGSMSAYEGLIVHDIVFHGLPANAQDHLPRVLSQKIGHPLAPTLIRQTIQTVHARPRSADTTAA